jgi:hypothetical protein
LVDAERKGDGSSGKGEEKVDARARGVVADVVVVVVVVVILLVAVRLVVVCARRWMGTAIRPSILSHPILQRYPILTWLSLA